MAGGAAVVQTITDNVPQLERNILAFSLESEAISIDMGLLNLTTQDSSSNIAMHLVEDLPLGFRKLARQPSNGLSNCVIYLLACIATTDTLLNHVSRCKSSRR